MKKNMKVFAAAILIVALIMTPQIALAAPKFMATAPSASLSAVYVKKGDSITIKGRYLAKGDKVKSYTSSKKSVATISKKGKLKAKKVGVTTITVKTKKGKKDTIKVHVVKKAKKAKKITLPKTKAMMTKQVVRLPVKVTPAKSTSTIKWTSSDESVATVDAAGYVKAKSSGTVKIVGKTSSGKKATCKITVNELIPAIAITVAPESQVIYLPQKLMMTATLTPADPNVPSNDIIEWSSSKETVATVSPNGEVQSVGVGVAKITAHAVGSDIKATATITVSADPGKSVKITPGERVKLDFTKYGVSTNTGLTYSSSKESIATVSADGYIQANFRDKETGKAKTGTTTVKATTPDGDAATVYVTVTNEPTIVDLSKWQGDIDWSQAYKAIDLAVLRVTYGADKSYELKYPEYADSCAEYGVPFGVYSYCLYKSKSAAEKEAEAFYKQATSGGRAPLFFVLDIEESSFTKVKLFPEYTEAYIEKLRELAESDGIGRLKIGIYIGHHLYEKLKINMEPDPDDPTTLDFVWIPRYNLPNNGGMTPSAKIPDHPCDIWQYSSGAYLPGIKGKVDVNTLYDPLNNPLSAKEGFGFDWLIAGADAAV